MEAPFLLESLERSRRLGAGSALDEPLVSALGDVLLAWLVSEHAQTPPRLQREPFARLGCMSPEQARGRPIDVRSDVFAAGALLFELACGKRPFDGISELVEGEISTPRAANPRLSEPLAAVLSRALAADPQARYATAAELRAALELASPPAGPDAVEAWAARLQEPAPPKAGDPAAAPPQPKRRLPLRWLGATAFVVVPIAATLFVLRAHEQHQLDVEEGYAASLRPCEILTDPPGAALIIDGVTYSERAPTVVRFEPGRDYVIEVKGAGGYSASRKIRDQKRLVIRLSDGAVTESIVYGAPPKHVRAAARPAEAQQPAKTAAPEATTSKRIVPYDFEKGPVEFTLEPEHQVGIPPGNCIEVPATRKKPFKTHASHVLALFTPMKGSEQLVTLEDWAPEPGQLCVFVVTDSASHFDLNKSLLRWEQSLSVVKKPLVYVDGTDRVLVRSFAPGTWRVRVTGGSGGYHPVLVTVSHQGGDDDQVLDQYETFVENPKAMWFTVPVIEAEPDLRFAVRIDKVR